MTDEKDATLRLATTDQTRWIVVLAGPEMQELPLPSGGSITVGRAPSCDLVIPHASVSREHLRLHVAEKSVFVEDLGAVNAARVAGVSLRPHERVELPLGTLVDVGAVGLMVRAGAQPERALPLAPSTDIERFAKSSLTVLIQGETGSGKDVLAERIHRLSPRAEAPLLSLNCAAVTDTLMESELFGHERGAFTGAIAPKPGLFETANGGTVFLDEIGDMSLFLQAKLLRVLEERKVWRVGALKPRPIDVRFIAATNRDLDDLVVQGKFRQDLLFRLNAITLHVEPLRARTNEIDSLAKTFIAEACRDLGCPPLPLAPEALQALLRYGWPGNVRELRNVMGRAVATCAGAVIREEDLGLRRAAAERGRSQIAEPHAAEHGNLHAAVDALEEDRILKALKTCGFNRTKTARMLGIARNTLASRMARFGIDAPDRE